MLVIEILTTPEGKHPQWVREAWVGLKLPCLRDELVTMPVAHIDENLPRNTFGFFMRRFKEGVTQTGVENTGYLISIKTAVGILSLTNEDAAKWWIETIPEFIARDEALLFESTCCRPV